MGKTKTDSEWLRDRLTILTKLASKVLDNKMTTDYGDYTALKLIAINYYAGIFSSVARSPTQKQWYDGAVYVDLFAGTGLVKLKDTNYYLPGSPTAAALNNNGFDYIICVEKCKDKCDILENRLSRISGNGNFAVLNGDSNVIINDIISLIKSKFQNPIILTFVDPEGLEVKFLTLKALSDAFPACDFMVNVNAMGATRVAKKLEKGIENVKNSLEKYLDTDANIVLRELAEGKPIQNQYTELIKDVLGKKMGDIITIHDEGDKIAYYLLGYTRLTKGGSGYVNGFSVLKRRLEWADRNHVRRILDVIHGKNKTID